jgi:hypothetical protein
MMFGSLISVVTWSPRDCAMCVLYRIVPEDADLPLGIGVIASTAESSAVIQ